MSIEKNITRLFEEIKSTKNSIKEFTSNSTKSSVSEADISGIDELVYNPATKKGGPIGFGFDGGRKVDGITWGNHDNHLHIGFTNREVAMDVIDKAHEMGLTTTENPYAKKDPNGKVDNVHTNNSFHYKTFEGEPPVGAGVDISGNQDTITELMKWVIQKYSGGNYTVDQTIDSTNSSEDAYNYATGKTGTEVSPKSSYARVAGTIKSIEGINENREGDIERIFELYELIIHNSNLNEVSSESDNLFGGKNVKIPVDGAHAGQSGWASGNAWDVAGEIGTPVYAIASGQATTFTDYGSEVIARDGKKLFGQSFTVQSYDGLPDVYYTHLEGSPVTKGSEVKCGQFVGYIVDFPDSSYDHVHIGVESGNIRQFLNDDGSIKCAKGQELGSSSTSNNASEDAYNYATGKEDIKSSPRPQYARIAGSVKSIEGINESRSLGKNSSNRYGRIILPKDDNPKIKSPISGKINNSKFFSGCVNQLTIENNDNGTTYLQYCGISSPSLSNGDRVSPGDLLGRTDTDVEVNMFDHTWSKIPITDTSLPAGKKETDTDTEKKKKSSDPEYWDPFMAALIGAPLKIFQDKYDKEGNRTEKRYGGVADKKQVDPFVLNFLKDPFNRKKVNENIERIKKML